MKFIIPVLVAMIFLPLPLQSYAQNFSSSDLIQANFGGPVFLDAFWTDRTALPTTGTLEKIEVGPGEGSSVLAIILVNRGFSDITAVTGTLTLPMGFKASGSESAQAVATASNIVKAGDSLTLFFQVDISPSTNVKAYSGSLKVDYFRTLEVGAPRTTIVNIPFKLTGKVVLDASVENRIIPGISNKVIISITNTGSATATGVVVKVPGSSGLNSATGQASVVSIGQKSFEAGGVPPGGKIEIFPLIYASNSAGETLQTMTLEVTYGNPYGIRKIVNIPVGVIVQPKPAESILSVTPTNETQSSVIIAGKVVSLNFTISNIGNKTLSDAIVSLQPESTSVKVLGASKWTVGNMGPGFTHDYSTQVFASKDMISKPTSFNITVQYVTAGESKTETLNLGSYVDGEIKVRAYDISITYIGGTPNITGNLLNEGNVLALFTTVDVKSAEGLTSKLPPQQYLGDLSENSPLPFSIPVELKNDVRSGTYPIVLKVEYKDTLKQVHVLEVSNNVAFVREQQKSENNAVAASQSGNAMVGIIAGMVVAVVIAVVVLRKRKKSALKHTLKYSKHSGNSDDIESVLDSQLGKKTEENK